MGIAHRPLHTEQSEQERDAIIPSSCLIDDALTSKHIRGRVHLRSGSSGEQDDDDKDRRAEVYEDEATSNKSKVPSGERVQHAMNNKEASK